MAFFSRAAAAATLSVNAGTVGAVASRHASLRCSANVAVASGRFHTSALSKAAAPKEAVKDAAKSAAAQTASAAISNKAQKVAGQAVASARETAAIAANTPPPIPKIAPAAPVATSSSWSSSSSGPKRSRKPLSSALNATLFLVGGTLLFFYYRDSRAAIHRWIAIPALKAFLDPESAQKLAIDLLASGVAPVDVVTDDELLKTELFGMTLSNPIGLAAGFDKQAQAVDGLFDLGFGIVEVGSVTPEPQPGNPQPRYFRLLADDAAINRFGFNSDGHATILSRLRTRVDRWLLATDALAPSSSASGSSDSQGGALESRTSVTTVPHTSEQLPELIELDAEAALIRAGEVNPRAASSGASRLSLRPDRLLSINLGKNKTTAESQAVRDYILGIHALGPYADMLVVNISSPNTPGLRDLQRAEVLGNLLKELVKARDEMVREQEKLANAVSCPVYHPSSSGEATKPKKPEFRVPLVLKISPDLSESELDDIAEAVKMAKVDGLIVSNTTIQRPRTLLTSTVHNDPVVEEAGGLSGRPLKPLSLRALRHMSARLREDKIPLIGCGGIFSGADALEFAKAGASAVQIYTSFGYTGVGAPRRIKDELLELLKQEGKSWQELVGSEAASP